MRFFLQILIPALLLVINTPHAAYAGEKLHYQATYKGVLSLFQKLDIADVWYDSGSIETSGDDQSLQRVTLSVSSENFSTVERLYPFRYRFQSFFNPASSQTWLFENLKITKKGKKVKHKVGLFDLDQLQVKQFKGAHKKLVVTPELISPGFTEDDRKLLVQKLDLEESAKPLVDLERVPVDRLTMLQLITKQVRGEEASKQYLITSGDDLMAYHVELGKPELIQLDEKPVRAKKVKIEAFDLQPDENRSGIAGVRLVHADESLGSESGNVNPGYRHPPVYVWFSADERCIPLRFVNRHALGIFTVELVSDV